MSQQAAIRAEQEERARQRREQMQRLIDWLRRWAVLVLGVAVLVAGLGIWLGAGSGADVRTVEEMTAEQVREAEATEAEFEQAWDQVVAGASSVDTARIAADSLAIEGLLRPVAALDGSAHEAAEEAGVRPGDPYLGFLDRVQQELGGMDVASVHEVRTSLFESTTTANRYVVVVQFVDAVTVPTSPTSELAEQVVPADEASRWAVALVSFGPQGDLRSIEAHWTDGPPLRAGSR